MNFSFFFFFWYSYLFKKYILINSSVSLINVSTNCSHFFYAQIILFLARMSDYMLTFCGCRMISWFLKVFHVFWKNNIYRFGIFPLLDLDSAIPQGTVVSWYSETIIWVLIVLLLLGTYCL